MPELTLPASRDELLYYLALRAGYALAVEAHRLPAGRTKTELDMVLTPDASDHLLYTLRALVNAQH